LAGGAADFGSWADECVNFVGAADQTQVAIFWIRSSQIRLI
jgi:hypothetical protein